MTGHRAFADRSYRKTRDILSHRFNGSYQIARNATVLGFIDAESKLEGERLHCESVYARVMGFFTGSQDIRDKVPLFSNISGLSPQRNRDS